MCGMPHVSRMMVMRCACCSHAVTFLSAAACGAHDAQTMAKPKMNFFMKAPGPAKPDVTRRILLAPEMECDDIVAGAPGAAAADRDRNELLAGRQPIAHR